MGVDLKPMSEQRAELPFFRAFTAEEMRRIAAGYIPTMFPDDKWFMFFEGNVLHVHRAYSGVCTYELHFEHDPLSGLTRTTKVVGDRSPEHRLHQRLRVESRLLEGILGGHFRLAHRDPLVFPELKEDAASAWDSIEEPELLGIENPMLTCIYEGVGALIQTFREAGGRLSTNETAQLGQFLHTTAELSVLFSDEEQQFMARMAGGISAVLTCLAKSKPRTMDEWIVREAAPRAFTYWVEPDLLMAGRHPRRTGYPTMVSSLVETNRVRTFIDLSGRTGDLDYEAALNELRPKMKEAINYFRVPLRGGSVPDSDRQMIAILDILDEAVHRARSEGTKIYVHCSTGAGRTGLVLGCYLVRHGMPGYRALEHLKRIVRPLPESDKLRIPETSKQREYILSWADRDTLRSA